MCCSEHVGLPVKVVDRSSEAVGIHLGKNLITLGLFLESVKVQSGQSKTKKNASEEYFGRAGVGRRRITRSYRDAGANDVREHAEDETALTVGNTLRGGEPRAPIALN